MAASASLKPAVGASEAHQDGESMPTAADGGAAEKAAAPLGGATAAAAAPVAADDDNTDATAAAEASPSASPSQQQPQACDVCHEQPHKYRCPGCGVRSCSLPCVQQHKAASGCSGKRDRLAFVPLAEFGDRELLSGEHLWRGCDGCALRGDREGTAAGAITQLPACCKALPCCRRPCCSPWLRP